MHSSTHAGIAFEAGRWPLASDRPTLVFLHGSAGGRVLWRGQVEALVDVANTIAIDLPGHGASAGPGRDRVSDYATAVRAFVESIEAPRPVACGLSIGGAIVLDLLLSGDDRWEAGVIVNSGARLRVAPLIFESIDQDDDVFVATASSGAASTTDPACLEPLVEVMAGCPPEVARGDFLACDRFDVMDRVGEIEVPCLVLTASEDWLTPPRYGEFLADRLPNAWLARIDRAGHLSPMERPEDVAGALRRFLGTLPGSSA